MNKIILVLVNHPNVIYNFRAELLVELLAKGYKVIISSPSVHNLEFLVEKGAIYEHVSLERRGKNFFKDFSIVNNYVKLVKKYKPNIILSYTIKPNLYGSFVSHLFKVPIIITITGLGHAFEKNSFLRNFLLVLYRVIFKKVYYIIFQNKANQIFFMKHNINGRNNILVNGSGVNITKFNHFPYENTETLNFLFVGRVIKDKGIDLFLRSAEFFKARYKNVVFHVLGECDASYIVIINDYVKKGLIEYHGQTKDVLPYYRMASAIIHPSFHEGMSNTLLEASAVGRPCIASNIPGCFEIIDHSHSGYLFEYGNQDELNRYLDKFIQLSFKEKENFGIKSRKIIEENFDRKNITQNYIKIIESFLTRNLLE